MELSKDEEVIELGLTPDEGRGLNVAVDELRRRVGPVDAYLANYSNRNGMKGGRTLIFGTKAPGRDGRPLLSIARLGGLHVLRFTVGSQEDRKVIQAMTGRSSWADVLDGIVFPLKTLATAPKTFGAAMEKVGRKLKANHKDVYMRRVFGMSRMPSAYRMDETPGPSASALLSEMDGVSNPTTRQRLMEARLGQGKFRREMLALWDHRCAVTGCTLLALIRASHAEPWACESSTEAELPTGEESRLDPHNGLPLVATLDSLFDAGLMTFDDEGNAIFADKGIKRQLTAAGLLPAEVRLRRRPGDRLKHYLTIHRTKVFRGVVPRSRRR